MANEKNLKKRTKEELRQLGSKGGKASGKARRKKADLRKAFDIILNSEVPDEQMANILETLGYENSNLMAMVFSMTNRAINGDVRAFEQIAKITSTKDKYDIAEQKERIKAMKESNRDEKEENNDIKITIDYGDEDESRNEQDI